MSGGVGTVEFWLVLVIFVHSTTMTSVHHMIGRQVQWDVSSCICEILFQQQSRCHRVRHTAVATRSAFTANQSHAVISVFVISPSNFVKHQKDFQRLMKWFYYI